MHFSKLEKTEISDFINLIKIFAEVFENDVKLPPTKHLGKLLANPDFMVFVARVNNQVVGGLTLYVLHSYYQRKPTAYIYDVGISPNFQAKGIGKALLDYTCGFCRKNNFDAAYVEAEGDDMDAISFYRKTNYTSEMNAVHFNYSLSGKKS